MTQTPEGLQQGGAEHTSSQMDAWSIEKLKAKITKTRSNLEEARALELAARIRYAEQRTPEAETALRAHRDEAARIHRRYVKLLDELERRSETYP